MKKFLFIACLLTISLMATAVNLTKAFSPPENDAGIRANLACAVVEVCGMTFEVTNNDIVAWQAPVVLNLEVSKMSAQVVAEPSFVLADGTVVPVTLVEFRWPHVANDYFTINSNRKNYNESRQYGSRSLDAYTFRRDRV